MRSLDDTLDNAKVITKGERMVIHEWDKVFIRYGAH